MRVTDFNKLRAELQCAVNGKEFTQCIYGKVYRLQEDKPNDAKALAIMMSNESMTVEYYSLYCLVDNKFGGKSYKDSKVTKKDYYRLTAKQWQNIAYLFLSLKRLEEYYK